MPQINKQALAQYIRSGCARQLALNLRPDNVRFGAERNAEGMPYPQSPRPGLRQIQEAGDEWQAEKLHDLTRTFPTGSVVGVPYQNQQGQTRYRTVTLDATRLRAASPVRFLVETEFDPAPQGGELEQALGLSPFRAAHQLEFAHLRPDIIVALPPGTFSRYLSPDGTPHDLPPNDARVQLRVIDIKMTAEPSPGYFAEVTYYSMALAAWLVDNQLDHEFVVVPDAAIWPGSHDASRLMVTYNEILTAGVQPTLAQLWDAMQEDLEPVPLEVFAFRVRRFFSVDVPNALGSHWQSLDWHVDNRCSFCEYLGENRGQNAQPPVAPHALHCLPTAATTDHLSRVAFVTQGARLSLVRGGVQQVQALAQRLPQDAVFDTHQALRATRTVVSARAAALQSRIATVAQQSGTSASMPKWTDLRLYISVDFDIGSAITVAFGLKGFWREPRAIQSPLTQPHSMQTWQATATIVTDRDIQAEQRELLAFLQRIHDILTWCQQQDTQNLSRPQLAGLTRSQQDDYRTKIQIYIWDTLQYEHLTRVVGRHLDHILANQNISYLAWLFPPEDLLENPDMVTRRSPLTIVRDVVRGLVAAPVEHYYSLLQVARHFHESGLPPNVATFNPHPLFTTPLSDQIPSERAHEIWSKVTTPNHWQTQLTRYQDTVTLRLRALETVAKRLEHELRTVLIQSAPVIRIEPPQRQSRVSADGQLWYNFARLNAALDDLDVQQVRAMPVHERVARFRSALLTQRLTGTAATQALQQLNVSTRPGLRVYELSADSVDLKAKPGDFSFALSPAADQAFLDRKISRMVRGTPLDTQLQQQLGNRFWRATMEAITAVTVIALDRNRGLVALAPKDGMPGILDSIERHGVASFAADVTLDPTNTDFFTRKLSASNGSGALQVLANPPLAAQRANARAVAATGQAGCRGPRRTAHRPPADFLWNATAMSGATTTQAPAAIQARLVAYLQSAGRSLNPSQVHAWQHALTHRASLIWGPPGTGKSLTVRAVIVGAILDAQARGQTIRVLLTASTYTAIDNVLADAAGDIEALLPGQCDRFRVRSRFQEPSTNTPQLTDVEIDRGNPSPVLMGLKGELERPTRCVLVGGTPEQVYNLLTSNQGSACDERFDLILVDEASQMDVAHSVLPFCAIAANGSIVLAGDHLQLPPIHKAEPPAGLEDMVGSIYEYWRSRYGVVECALDVNYRSNDTLVAFAREAGYRTALTSRSPNLRLELTSPLPVSQPGNWPITLHWTPEWTQLLDPDQPATCFVYEDGRSSQQNEFEADAVVALATLLHGRVASALSGEVDPLTGGVRPPSSTPYSTTEFWQKALGVVTPHRAQQAAIVSRLHQIFGASGAVADAIRDAVDTVERFQGQQRDVIIASYTLGDPDQIAEEDEFLMSLNRFNVVASRARAKLITLVTQEVVNHLSDELDTLRQSRLLKAYVESFCNDFRPMTLGYVTANGILQVDGVFKWRQ
ncbi:hypothetical protein GURASL_04600 [Geotalea uraniireducens]|uniref:DNA2/NAM7 helicase-like C-terminal domain-containing protein n=1 Tax=Geotalea uraniireducens TaxID=351604 RepID=A0ABM8EGL8_9BACT|nr:AAA domain-containing protein [Geotalea uraniireducens]BDV41537.1 hypothetical protein GURASL_04600 [Geotalea uraniireducens]